MSWFYFIFYISNYYIFSALIFSHNILLMWHLSQFLCMNSVSVQSILHQAATLIICHYKKIMLSYQYILFLKSSYCCPNALKINVKLGTIASGWKHDCLWVKISVIYFKYKSIFFSEHIIFDDHMFVTSHSLMKQEGTHFFALCWLK